MSEEPIDDYLWDGSGEADELVARLERLLQRFRYRRPFSLSGEGGSDDRDGGEEDPTC